MICVATLARPVHWMVYSDSGAGLKVFVILGNELHGVDGGRILTQYRRSTDLRHGAICQWIPGHVDIRCNDAVEELGGTAHPVSTKHLVTDSMSDIKLLLKSMGDDVCTSKWLQVDTWPSVLKGIDQEMKFIIPDRPLRNTETFLHTTYLSVPYGRHFLHLASNAAGPDDLVGGTDETIEHIVMESSRYTSQGSKSPGKSEGIDREGHTEERLRIQGCRGLHTQLFLGHIALIPVFIVIFEYFDKTHFPCALKL